MALVIPQNWHVISIVLAGAMAFGALKSDVKDLKHSQEELKTDHDLIVEMRAEGKDRDVRVQEIRDDVKELLRQNGVKRK